MIVGNRETGTPLARADGDGAERDRRERPHERVVSYAPILPPLLEAHWAPGAGGLLESIDRQHLGPTQEREEPQVAPAGQRLQYPGPGCARVCTCAKRRLGQRERRDAPGALACDSQRLATGRQDLQPGAVAEHRSANSAQAAIRCSQLFSTSWFGCVVRPFGPSVQRWSCAWLIAGTGDQSSGRSA
jgi:hypothetical protein